MHRDVTQLAGVRAGITRQPSLCGALAPLCWVCVNGQAGRGLPAHCLGSWVICPLNGYELWSLQAGVRGRAWGTEPLPRSSGCHGGSGCPEEVRSLTGCPRALPKFPVVRRSGCAPPPAFLLTSQEVCTEQTPVLMPS